MLNEIIAGFLALSILLYAVLGGADFGAGILEAFLNKKRTAEQREIISHAMGPVWEANHMWLVLAIVIFFNGFPAAFQAVCISFHIPLTLMLIGIILRGCAFTFRHYDAVRDRSQHYYSMIFIVSSFLTPFMLGTIAGGILLGRATHPLAPIAGAGYSTYYTIYIAPWFHFFSLAIGVFTCALFAFLAAVYLIGESEDPEMRHLFVRRAQIANGVAVVAGVLVFVGAEIEHFPLFKLFSSHLFSSACMGMATFLLLPLWKSLNVQSAHQAQADRSQSLPRILVATQVMLVLLGWMQLQFPALLVMREQDGALKALTLYNAAAPESTLKYLLFALLGGSLIIFPALFYLLKIFKWKPE